MAAGSAAILLTTDDLIDAPTGQLAEQRAIALWRDKAPSGTFYPFLTVQVGTRDHTPAGVTLADLLAFAEAERLDPAEVKLAVVAGGEVVPAAIRPGARGTPDRTFVITTADDPEL